MMGNTRGKHSNKDGFLPIGYVCGGLKVVSERKKREDGKKHNLWGYDCLCRYCLNVKWVSYASLSRECARSCGCKTREWLSVSASKTGEGGVFIHLSAEEAFVRKWTR
jgi:hypothetical protein